MFSIIYVIRNRFSGQGINSEWVRDRTVTALMSTGEAWPIAFNESKEQCTNVELDNDSALSSERHDVGALKKMGAHTRSIPSMT